ncbi:MAG: NUDIX hydrolase [Planctomycetota bacterium]|jgi:8-oxo-dGTP pyrophosphatase MutT (NUDIX family)
MRPLHADDLRNLLDPLPQTWPADSSEQAAAVLAPWITRDGQDYLLFTERPEHLAQHPGQISFPGGMREGSESPLDCALREAHEEIALEAEHVEVLGAMAARPSRTGFLVQVLVGRVTQGVELVPDPREVECIHEVPLRDLRVRERWIWPPAPAPHASCRPPCFEIEGNYLWGLTARFTLDLLERLP